MGVKYVKNQHYIPQSLLNYFANSKSQIFECLVEQKKVYQTNLSNSMSEKFAYEHPMIEKNTVERYFHKIENYIGFAVDKIINTIAGYEKGEKDFLEVKAVVFNYMSEFIIFYYRSGALLTEYEFNMIEKADRVFLMLEKIINSKYIRDLSETIVKYYNFAIIKSDKNEFLLSDQYVSTVALGIKNRFFDVSNRNMGLKDVMILIPLSGEYYALFYNGKNPDYISDDTVNNLSQVQVDEVNEIIINNSYKKSICNSKDAINRVINKFEYVSPTSMFTGGNGINSGAILKKEIFFYKMDKKTWDMFTSDNWNFYRKLNRYDKCACNSGKKLKKCCISHLKACERMYIDIVNEKEDYKVHEDAIAEKRIAEFYKNDNRL